MLHIFYRNSYTYWILSTRFCVRCIMYIILSACHNTKAEINMPELGCELTSVLPKTVCSSRSTTLKASQFTQAVCGGART